LRDTFKAASWLRSAL